jgi:putative hydroxymethylpyrimidine transport system permease protein
MKYLKYVFVLFSLLLLWQAIAVGFKLPEYILPTPIEVFLAWIHSAGLIGAQSIPTLIETLLGFIIGSLLGIFAALTMTLCRPAKLWLLPILLASQAIPTFAIAPLLVIWLGYGMASKIATTVIMLFFPVTSSFFDGLKRTDPQYLDLAKTMNASRFKTLLHIRIPSALPSLASGLRVAATLAPIGAVVGEWVGSSQGLGFLMLNANARMEISLMFASLFTIAVFTLILYFSVDMALNKLIPWTS